MASLAGGTFELSDADVAAAVQASDYDACNAYKRGKVRPWSADPTPPISETGQWNVVELGKNHILRSSDAGLLQSEQRSFDTLQHVFEYATYPVFYTLLGRAYSTPDDLFRYTECGRKLRSSMQIVNYTTTQADAENT
eukprot:3741873-Rhodomonas_salina.2